MALQRLSGGDWARAVLLGFLNGLLLSLVMVPAFKAGLSPFPKPLGLAFAQWLLGPVPLPIGLLFHLVYVTFWSALFVALFARLTLRNAALLALVLWVIALVLFMPLVGWGLFGLAVGPMVPVAALVPHALFALFLWLLCRWVFPDRR
jgi:hypothetical protein